MGVRQFQGEADSLKRLYWEWLRALSPEQGRIWLAFVQDALREESGRGSHLDQKGNWVLAAALAAMGATGAAAGTIVQGLGGRAFMLAMTSVVFSLVFLVAAVGLVILGMGVRASFCQPDPEVVFRPEIMSADASGVQRDLILHYVESFAVNRRVSEQKATRLQWAQLMVLVGIALAVATAIGRVATRPACPASPAVVGVVALGRLA